MSSAIPFLPPALETASEMLATKKIPALDGEQMEALCSYLFSLRDRDQRIDIAEIAYLNHDDPQALNIFLACVLPMAQRMAENKAYRIFVHPTDWQLEAMYDGAVTNLLEMFEANRPMSADVPNGFRRYLLKTIVYGAMYPFRVRQENWHIEGVEDVGRFSGSKGYPNQIEREVLARKLLEQVTTFPHLREEHARMLKTIAAMGPEQAMRHDNCYWKNGRHEPASKQIRGRRAMLDLPAIVEAMGVPYLKGQNLLRESRQILREFFNRDGRLFVGQ